MPPRKSKKPVNKKKVIKNKNKNKNTIIVNVNSHNKRKASATAKASSSSNNSPPFMILQQPAQAPQPIPYPQFLPQPSFNERQVSNLAPPVRLPFIQDLAIEEQRGSTDTVRENEIRDDVAQNIREDEMRKQRINRFKPFVVGTVPTTDNPMLQLPQRHENIQLDNVLDEQAVVPRGVYKDTDWIADETGNSPMQLKKASKFSQLSEAEKTDAYKARAIKAAATRKLNKAKLGDKWTD